MPWIYLLDLNSHPTRICDEFLYDYYHTVLSTLQEDCITVYCSKNKLGGWETLFKTTVANFIKKHNFFVSCSSLPQMQLLKRGYQLPIPCFSISATLKCVDFHFQKSPGSILGMEVHTSLKLLRLRSTVLRGLEIRFRRHVCITFAGRLSKKVNCGGAYSKLNSQLTNPWFRREEGKTKGRRSTSFGLFPSCKLFTGVPFSSIGAIKSSNQGNRLLGCASSRGFLGMQPRQISASVASSSRSSPSCPFFLPRQARSVRRPSLSRSVAPSSLPWPAAELADSSKREHGWLLAPLSLYSASSWKRFT